MTFFVQGLAPTGASASPASLRASGGTNPPLAERKQKLAETRNDNLVRRDKGLIEIKAAFACRNDPVADDEFRFRRPPVYRDLGVDARVQSGCCKLTIMMNANKLYCGLSQPADVLRYGQGHGTPHSMNRVSRRSFLKTAAAATACAVAAPLLIGQNASGAAGEPSAAKLPRWRGFNLLEKSIKRREGNPAYRETDFQIMHEWGFDFARLPMSYQCWSEPDPERWLKMDEAQLKHVDAAVELGRTHRVHINLNLHRAPGYCVNPPKEPLDLWKDAAALDACAHHWAAFARRYKGLPNREVSFDLLNEPPDIPADTYIRIVKHLVAAIRAEDSQRLIIADGVRWGRDPVEGLAGLGIGQSTRGYDPMRVSHHKAGWVNGSDKWAEPTWPLKEGDKPEWNKDRLRRERIAPWQALEKHGVGVHVGEWGAHNRTPHKVALAWMRDQLELWKEAGWGWALWNLRGSFGVLDSGRTDMTCEDFRGHKLDREMLKLLQAG